MTRKSLISLFMAIAMVVSLAVPAFASAATTYTITANYDDTMGYVTVKENAEAGETVQFTATPMTGFELKSVSATSSAGAITPTAVAEGVYSFTMPEADVTINVTFEEPVYAYTLQLDYDTSFGELWFEDDRDGADQGDTVKVYYRCEDGYTIDTVKARYGTKSITATEGALDYYYFKMPAADVTVYADFRSSLGDYEITLDNDDNKGDVTVAAAANKNDNVRIYVTPYDGYQVANISVYRTNRTSTDYTVYDGNGYSYFKMPAYDVTVEVTYTSVSGYYADLDFDDDKGHVWLNKYTAAADTNIRVYFEEYAGYEVKSVTTTPSVTVYKTTSYYHFNMPSSDITVNVEFGEYTGDYDVNLDFDGIGGDVTLNRSEADYGDTVKIYVDPDANYDVDTLTVKDSSNNTVKVYSEDDYYYFTMPSKNVTVYVELYEYDGSGDYDITLSSYNTNYGIVRLSQTSADKNERVTVTVTPASGYKVYSISCERSSSGSSVSVTKTSSTKYYFTMPAADVDVTVIFTKSSSSSSDDYDGDYYIDVDYDLSMGDVELDEYMAYEGDIVKIYVTPDDYCDLDEISVYSLDYDEYVSVKKGVGYYYFTMPDSDVYIEVTFYETDDDDYVGRYDVDLDYDEYYGDVTVKPYSSTADAGDTVKIYVTPEEGYEFDDIEVRKNSNRALVTVKEGSGYYYFTMPSGDVTVSVEFYESDGEFYVDTDYDYDEGTVSVTPKNANEGETVKIYVYPDSGYVVYSVKVYNDVTNISISVKKTDGYYYFKMPDEDVTVYVEFDYDEDYEDYEDDDDDETSSNYKYNIDFYYDEEYADAEISADRAREGTKVTVDIDTVSGSSVKKVYAIATESGEMLTVKRSGTSYYFTMPDSDVFVDVVFKEEATGAYDVDIDYDSDYGSVVASASMAGRNTNVRFYVTPEDGYEIESITVTRSESSRTITYTEYADHVYAFTMPAADVVINVEFKAEEVHYAANLKLDSAMGSATLSANVATQGTVIKVTPAAKTGYLIDSVTVTEYSTNKAVTVTEANGVYSFTMPAASVNVNVTFKKQPVNYYIVTDSNKAEGNVTTSAGFATAGTLITVTVAPATGFKVDTVKGAYTSNGTTLICTPGQNNTYSFIMPEDNVKITVTFKKAEPVNALKFTDIVSTEWYVDAVEYVVSNGIMNGVGDNLFDPKGTTTKAMVTTVLWRIAGSPASTAEMSYTDVADGQWYTEAVRWAKANGLLINVSAGDKFEPNATITREQFADMIYRFEVYKAGGTLEKPAYQLNFSDLSLLSDWAKDSMNWCNVNKIINGNANGTLNPKGSTTRAELAQILLNYKDFN